ncbi:hypothetical protein SO694_00160043 [Aureococcus anophagefferens]|uniref:Fe2OG dioxygenase domain-containing protein n=1 Tax=Aureococcus anophagefferens TaxID=44056 RepID=A0ABR1G600_AURAN
MGPPSSPVPAPPPASADAAAVRAYATTLKDLGNDRFAAGDDDSASALYGKALDACHGSMGDLRCAALCNRAACHLRAKRWRACVADCDAALALDGPRAKALYRRTAEGLGTSRPRPGTTRRFSSSSLGTRTRRSARARPAPAPGDLAEDFDAFSVRVRLAVSSLEDVGVARRAVGPGRTQIFNPTAACACRAARRRAGSSPTATTRRGDAGARPSPGRDAASRTPSAARRRPFHAAGARPLEAGAHRLVVSRRGEELAAAAFDAAAAAAAAALALLGAAPRRAPRLARRLRRDVRRRPVVQGRAPAPARRAGAARDRAGARRAQGGRGAARGAVLVLPGFVDAAEAARIVAAASERGAMGPAREERGGGAAAAAGRTPAAADGRCLSRPRRDGARALPGCAPDRVEVQVVRYGAGERYDNHHDAVASGPDGRGGYGRGRFAPGVDIAARPGDGLLWHNVDEWGRRDERVEHARPAPDPQGSAGRAAAERWARGAHRGAAEPRTPQAGRAVGAGVKWGVNVWLYSRAALQHKALLRVRAPPPVLAALRTFVGDAAPLEPGTYPRDLFKSPQDPTPADAFPTLEAFARAMPPDSRRCVHAGAEISLRCCEGFRDGEARAFSVAEFLSRGRCGGVATALQTVAIDHHVAFKVDGVQVGLGSRPPPRWPPPGGGDDSD